MLGLFWTKKIATVPNNSIQVSTKSIQKFRKSFKAKIVKILYWIEKKKKKI